MLENDALFADLVLPLCTQLEREDFGYHGLAPRMNRGMDQSNMVMVYTQKCIEPLGESKSDYDIALLVAKRLGLENEFTEGNTVEDWIRKCFQKTSLPEHISFEEFKKKGYYVFKFPTDWPRNPGLRRFSETATGLNTPSGKIEFFSQRLAENFPGDEERPPSPQYIAEGITHQESITSTRAKTYPLLVESPHPRYRFHSQYETIPWLHEIPTHKIIKDGYAYEALWMNPSDAGARGIKQDDMVRIFNERGSVVTAAYVTERMMPGVVRIPNGAGYNPIEIGKSSMGGTINTICPLNTTSRNAFGMVTNAYLVQVEKWEEKV
jgi:anaerobic selenocysteine-containing dehydrogenase